MKKTVFYKAKFNGIGEPPKYEKAEGYRQLYTVTGTDIEISLIFEKRELDWAITEEKSGLLVWRNFRTRKEAEAFITPEFLQKISDVLYTTRDYVTMLNIYRGRVEA